MERWTPSAQGKPSEGVIEVSARATRDARSCVKSTPTATGPPLSARKPGVSLACSGMQRGSSPLVHQRTAGPAGACAGAAATMKTTLLWIVVSGVSGAASKAAMPNAGIPKVGAAPQKQSCAATRCVISSGAHTSRAIAETRVIRGSGGTLPPGTAPGKCRPLGRDRLAGMCRAVGLERMLAGELVAGREVARHHRPDDQDRGQADREGLPGESTRRPRLGTFDGGHDAQVLAAGVLGVEPGFFGGGGGGGVVASTSHASLERNAMPSTSVLSARSG